MSDTIRSRSSNDGETLQVPRARIHKKILDAAAEQPEASMETIADRVSGASVGLVEQVLDDYGDPADEQETDSPSGKPDEAIETDSPMALSNQEVESPADSPVDLSELTDKQRETIRAIVENPHATQTDLAEEFGVSAATINHRVNSIPGFEWKLRHRFIDTMLDEDTPTMDEGNEGERPAAELSERVADLEERLALLEERGDPSSGSSTVVADPELVHKVVHACLESDRITEDEELQILESLLE